MKLSHPLVGGTKLDVLCQSINKANKFFLISIVVDTKKDMIAQKGTIHKSLAYVSVMSKILEFSLMENG
jgi:hypothetical protein